MCSSNIIMFSNNFIHYGYFIIIIIILIYFQISSHLCTGQRKAGN